MQADFTGGEPLARTDIIELVRLGSFHWGLLISSGLPLDETKLAALVEAGLDHFQLSFQARAQKRPATFPEQKPMHKNCEFWSGSRNIESGWTLNFVIHRQNIRELEEMLALVEEQSPGCVEFASVQYYGYGLANRARLLPTREQLDYCVETLKKAEERLKGKTRVVFVVPDYYARYPKPCVGGWGRKLMLISPNGTVLPCHAASVIPGLQFENVKEKALREIWEESTSFRAFRGEEWMQEPCKSCDRRGVDFGGCRCQALLLTGDATATDPVCSLAPTRPLVDAILAGAADPHALISVQPVDWIYRPILLEIELSRSGIFLECGSWDSRTPN